MDLNEAFMNGIEKCPEFKRALKIVSNNSYGNTWLIGGMVYRTIVSEIYGRPRPRVDLDFIVEYDSPSFNLPRGWEVEENSFSNPKFRNGEETIDYVPLKNIFSIRNRGLEPKIENYLSGVPLTVNSIVFDIEKQKLMGEIGIQAIIAKTVAVNNFHFAKYAAEKKKKTLNQFIKEKADSLNFTPVFPKGK